MCWSYRIGSSSSSLQCIYINLCSRSLKGNYINLCYQQINLIEELKEKNLNLSIMAPFSSTPSQSLYGFL